MTIVKLMNGLTGYIKRKTYLEKKEIYLLKY